MATVGDSQLAINGDKHWPPTGRNYWPLTLGRIEDADRAAVWTWPTVTLTCVLVLAALVFVGVLVWKDTSPGAAASLALLLVTGIVLCVLPSRPRKSLVRRAADAIAAFVGGQGGGQ